jgi:hypothetical protein
VRRHPLHGCTRSQRGHRSEESCHASRNRGTERRRSRR